MTKSDLPVEIATQICEYVFLEAKLSDWLNIRLLNKTYDHIIRYLILSRGIIFECRYEANHSSRQLRSESTQSHDFVADIWAAFPSRSNCGYTSQSHHQPTSLEELALLLACRGCHSKHEHHEHVKEVKNSVVRDLGLVGTALFGSRLAFDCLVWNSRGFSYYGNPGRDLCRLPFITWALYHAVYNGMYDSLFHLTNYLSDDPWHFNTTIEGPPSPSTCIVLHEASKELGNLSRTRIRLIFNTCVFLATIQSDSLMMYQLMEAFHHCRFALDTSTLNRFMIKQSPLCVGSTFIKAFGKAGGNVFDYHNICKILGSAFHIKQESSHLCGESNVQWCPHSTYWNHKRRNHVLSTALRQDNYRLAQLTLSIAPSDHNTRVTGPLATIFASQKTAFADTVLLSMDLMYKGSHTQQVELMLSDLNGIVKSTWILDIAFRICLQNFLARLLDLLNDEQYQPASDHRGVPSIKDLAIWKDLASVRLVLDFMRNASTRLQPACTRTDFESALRIAYKKGNFINALSLLAHHDYDDLVWPINERIKPKAASPKDERHRQPLERVLASRSQKRRIVRTCCSRDRKPAEIEYQKIKCAMSNISIDVGKVRSQAEKVALTVVKHKAEPVNTAKKRPPFRV